ncbi:hypothetical protein HK104_007733 [Borealophlyctis nickersoniae]|nr:hypothetical protein HK104_007733 [Borealophlyctis nickersoniae]
MAAKYLCGLLLLFAIASSQAQNITLELDGAQSLSSCSDVYVNPVLWGIPDNASVSYNWTTSGDVTLDPLGGPADLKYASSSASGALRIPYADIRVPPKGGKLVAQLTVYVTTGGNATISPSSNSSFPTASNGTFLSSNYSQACLINNNGRMEIYGGDLALNISSVIAQIANNSYGISIGPDYFFRDIASIISNLSNQTVNGREVDPVALSANITVRVATVARVNGYWIDSKSLTTSLNLAISGFTMDTAYGKRIAVAVAPSATCIPGLPQNAVFLSDSSFIYMNFQYYMTDLLRNSSDSGSPVVQQFLSTVAYNLTRSLGTPASGGVWIDPLAFATNLTDKLIDFGKGRNVTIPRTKTISEVKFYMANLVGYMTYGDPLGFTEICFNRGATLSAMVSINPWDLALNVTPLYTIVFPANNRTNLTNTIYAGFVNAISKDTAGVVPNATISVDASAFLKRFNEALTAQANGSFAAEYRLLARNLTARVSGYVNEAVHPMSINSSKLINNSAVCMGRLFEVYLGQSVNSTGLATNVTKIISSNSSVTVSVNSSISLNVNTRSLVQDIVDQFDTVFREDDSGFVFNTTELARTMGVVLGNYMQTNGSSVPQRKNYYWYYSDYNSFYSLRLDLSTSRKFALIFGDILARGINESYGVAVNNVTIANNVSSAIMDLGIQTSYSYSIQLNGLDLAKRMADGVIALVNGTVNGTSVRVNSSGVLFNTSSVLGNNSVVYINREKLTFTITRAIGFGIYGYDNYNEAWFPRVNFPNLIANITNSYLTALSKNYLVTLDNASTTFIAATFKDVFATYGRYQYDYFVLDPYLVGGIISWRINDYVNANGIPFIVDPSQNYYIPGSLPSDPTMNTIANAIYNYQFWMYYMSRLSSSFPYVGGSYNNSADLYRVVTDANGLAASVSENIARFASANWNVSIDYKFFTSNISVAIASSANVNTSLVIDPYALALNAYSIVYNSTYGNTTFDSSSASALIINVTNVIFSKSNETKLRIVRNLQDVVGNVTNNFLSVLANAGIDPGTNLTAPVNYFTTRTMLFAVNTTSAFLVVDPQAFASNVTADMSAGLNSTALSIDFEKLRQSLIAVFNYNTRTVQESSFSANVRVARRNLPEMPRPAAETPHIPEAPAPRRGLFRRLLSDVLGTEVTATAAVNSTTAAPTLTQSAVSDVIAPSTPNSNSGPTYNANATVIAKLTTSIVIQFSPGMFPTVNIHGGSSFNMSVADDVILGSDVTYPSCDDSGADVTTAVSFKWAVTDDTGKTVNLGSLSGASYTSDTLYIPARRLTGNKNYQVTCTLYNRNNTLLSNSTVSLYLSRPDVIAIVDGAYREVGTNSDLVISGEDSYDPSDPNAVLNYNWTCYALDNSSTCPEPSSYSNGLATVTIPAGKFTPGSFNWVLMVSNNATKSTASDNTVIQAFASLRLSCVAVLDNPSSPDKVTSAYGDVVGVVVYCNEDDSTILDYAWSVDNANVTLTNSTIFDYGGPNQDSMYFIPGALPAGVKLTFTVKAKDATQNVTASASVTISIALPPYGGKMVANKLGGLAYTEDFTFTATGWKSKLPGRLTYSYDLIAEDYSEYAIAPRSSASSVTVTIPVTGKAKVICYIYDSMGGWTASQAVEITTTAPPVQAALDSLSTKLSTITAGDTTTLTNILLSVTNILYSSLSGGYKNDSDVQRVADAQLPLLNALITPGNETLTSTKASQLFSTAMSLDLTVFDNTTLAKALAQISNFAAGSTSGTTPVELNAQDVGRLVDTVNALLTSIDPSASASASASLSKRAVTTTTNSSTNANSKKLLDKSDSVTIKKPDDNAVAAAIDAAHNTAKALNLKNTCGKPAVTTSSKNTVIAADKPVVTANSTTTINNFKVIHKSLINVTTTKSTKGISTSQTCADVTVIIGAGMHGATRELRFTSQVVSLNYSTLGAEMAGQMVEFYIPETNVSAEVNPAVCVWYDAAVGNYTSDGCTVLDVAGPKADGSTLVHCSCPYGRAKTGLQKRAAVDSGAAASVEFAVTRKPADDTNPKAALGLPAIVGIAVGGFVGVAMLVGGSWYAMKKRG